MALTETWLKSNLNKPRKKKLTKSDRDGLSIRVSPKGKITFMLRYYYCQKRRDLDMGSYPLLTLKEARAETLRLRKHLEQGHDPKVVRQLERQAIIAAETLKGLFDIWYESYCIKNKQSHLEVKRSFERYVFPKIGHLPAEKITLHAWLDILEPLALKVPSVAERILANSKQMFKFAVKRQLLPINVLSDIFAKEDLQVRRGIGERVLSDEEMKMFWMAANQSTRLAEKNSLFVKLCLIYGCRNGELRRSEKSDFDFEKRVWTIPPENHKRGKITKKPLLKPITSVIETYLKKLFALSPKSKYTITDDGLIEQMRLGAAQSIPYSIMRYLRRYESYEMSHFSMHDLRRTARTNFSTLTEPHIAEILLGHSLGGIWRTYDKHDYLKEQARAISAWTTRLFTIVGEAELAPPNDNVICVSFSKTNRF